MLQFSTKKRHIFSTILTPHDCTIEDSKSHVSREYKIIVEAARDKLLLQKDIIHDPAEGAYNIRILYFSVRLTPYEELLLYYYTININTILLCIVHGVDALHLDHVLIKKTTSSYSSSMYFLLFSLTCC